MRDKTEDLKLAFDLIHYFGNGTINIEKGGDQINGEWFVCTFTVGYSREKYLFESNSFAKSVIGAAEKVDVDIFEKMESGE